MPIYEYRCQKCGNTFEVIQKFSDEALQTHPDCGGAVEKLISTSALQFKGTGFYITDYAKSGAGAPAGGKDGKKDAGGGTTGSNAGASPESKGGAAKTGDSSSSSSTPSSSGGGSGAANTTSSSSSSSGGSDSKK